MAAVLLTTVSCHPDFGGFFGEKQGGIVLNFTLDGLQTKAPTDSAGVDLYHENTLTTIDYFLYKEGETNQNAYLHDRVVMSGRTGFNVLVDGGQLSNLFNGAAPGNNCDVYIIANYPTEITQANTDTTSLGNMVTTYPFTTYGQKSPNKVPVDFIPDDFIMTGAGKATVINKNLSEAASGTIALHRSACKITFECKLASSVEITNTITSGDEQLEQTITWKPITTGIYAYLVNGHKKVKACGDTVTVRDDALYRYNDRQLTDTHGEGWYTCAPFYSYPQEWHSGEEREPFIKLMVPWVAFNENDDNLGQKQFYYKVPCPGLKMEANTWYHIKLDVGILGGDDFEAMLEIQGQYYVLPWNTQTIVEADAQIKDARYISAPSQEYEMFNTERLDFPITSSHDDTLIIKSVTYYNHKTGADVNVTTTAKNNGWITFSNSTRHVTVNHTLNNNISSTDFDTSPYVFTFEVRHTDDASYTTGDIVVTQYPAMYIKSEKSVGGNNGYGVVYVNGTAYSGNSDYVTVSGTNSFDLGAVVKPSGVNGSGDNNNQYQYTVYVTTLPSDSEYVIGDPRIGTSTNAPSHLSALTGTYQAAADDTKDVIAPVFKIASSYGKTLPLPYENAKERCAAYQENGYPAGRWRLPTSAEIRFLVSLSEYQKIPTLFNVSNNYHYWAGGNCAYGSSGIRDFTNATSASNGNVTLNNTTYSVYTRCVYDVWYWGDEKETVNAWNGYMTTQPD